MLTRYEQIQQNLILFEEEKKQRMSSFWYRLRFNIYKFKQWIKNGKSSRIN